ncbi:50S ribosomal protein L20 [Candidatus Gottesmanbacteria bacterium]|nr:50S ribosomal protein L20 [Candidatus Gottesmanbacteria bacterium]
MRVKRGVVSHAKHKKVFQANKGYRMTKRRLIRVAKEAYLHAGEYAFAGRRQNKRDLREGWISRISQALEVRGLKYSVFMHTVKKLGIEVDRKILAYLIVNKPEVFDAFTKQIQ